MKVALRFLALAATVAVVLWVVGLVEFTSVTYVPNEPLRRPRRVKELNGTNLVLESGQAIGLDPRYGAFLGLSNQLFRSDFQVDVEQGETNVFSLAENEAGSSNRLDIYVRRARRREALRVGFLIPLFRKTAGENYRAWVASGRYLALQKPTRRCRDKRSIGAGWLRSLTSALN